MLTARPGPQWHQFGEQRCMCLILETGNGMDVGSPSQELGQGGESTLKVSRVQKNDLSAWRESGLEDASWKRCC